MIKLLTDCVKCVHQDVCKYKHNARNQMDKLAKMDYGEGINDNWSTVSDVQHVTIGFSCDNFYPQKEVLHR